MMIQSPTDIQVNVCRPTYFYNISQQHNFMVYDFRPTECTSKLKNTLEIDSVTYLHELNNIKQAQDLQHYQINSNNDCQKVIISNLFKQRRRNFNFFLPFNASDSFSIYLSVYLYQLDQSKNQHHHDYCSVTLDSLEDVCQKFKAETQYELSYKRGTKSQSPTIEPTTSMSNISKQFSVESPEELNGIQQSKQLNKHFWPSMPNLLKYNILDQAISNFEIFQSMLKVIKVFKLEKVSEIDIIFEPATIMFDQYPLLDYCVHRNQKFLDKNLPNEIVEGKLYLGNASHAMNEDLLINSLKITHIVNAAKEVKNGLNGVHYLNIPIYDEETEKIFLHFEVVYQFIDKLWNDEDSKILVHCAQGRSRSAALVIMFLMRKYQWNLEKAHNYVQERREVVCVNDGFLQQLEKYQTILLQSEK